MKILKIDNNQGYFLDENGEAKTIDLITKEDLLRISDVVLDPAVDFNEKFEEFSEELLKNQAHQIIYKSVYSRLKELNERKEEFRDESDRLFGNAYEKYRE